jgi:predicted O-linked N-acetylglucosamine transferase (SPINDLY family)
MQAVECGTPIDAHEGSTMRANFGVAVLRQAGLGEWAATDVEGYAERVQRLCDDRALREQVSMTLRRAGNALFNDSAASKAMQMLLEQLARP